MKQLRTEFSKDISDQSVWNEYPRPSLVRSSYLNLNGLWDYAITEGDAAWKEPDGQILVPFSPECSLSGVMRSLMPGQSLWYRRTLSVPRPQPGKRLLLHFGAADQEALVFVNRQEAAFHQGGYLPFSADITDYLNSGDNELLVRVRDASDTSWHARGKQSLHPGGMFYTAHSGLWQTVWAEIVPDNYIDGMFFLPDFVRGLVRLRVSSPAKAPVRGAVLAEGVQVASFEGVSDDPIEIPLPDFRPWSPEDPFLYSVRVEMGSDRVSGYFAMRKCEIRAGADGLPRFFLNGRPCFQAGVLDQGYWPESLCTAPSDEALEADILRMKELGFNMLRKHAKIEPERFYYHCDRLGMLVWQDMVNGGTPYRSWFVTYLATLMNWLCISAKDGEKHYALLSRREEEGRQEFLRETAETVSFLFNHPCIVTWVLFNEGWGQFDSADLARRIRQMDPSRPVDHASGWFDQKAGDFLSLHYYFFTLRFRPEAKRAAALTEFGGYACRVPGHCASEKVYGYRTFQTPEDLTAGYEKLMETVVLPAVKKGVCATVYTQLSDIEEEVNGIYTYDRAVCKLDPETVRRWNKTLKETGERLAGFGLAGGGPTGSGPTD